MFFGCCSNGFYMVLAWFQQGFVFCITVVFDDVCIALAWF